MELLSKIQKALPRGFPPDDVEDVVQEIAILVLSGRIDENHLEQELSRYLPTLRKRYQGLRYSISLDQPVSDENATTLGEIVVPATTTSKKTCPNCRRKVKPGRTYCRNICARIYYQKQHTLANPKEVEHLSKTRWMSRDAIAKALGVTRHAINNVISRHKLSRFLPEVCKISGCGRPVVRHRNAWGNMVGNMCQRHYREAMCNYTRKHRAKTIVPSTPEQRKENARRASQARWARQRERERT